MEKGEIESPGPIFSFPPKGNSQNPEKLGTNITVLNVPELIHVLQEQGRRPYQEDRYSYDELFPGVIWAAVYDGHGGDLVSEVARTVLPEVIREYLEPHVRQNTQTHSDSVISAITAAVLQADRRIFDQLVSVRDLNESDPRRLSKLMRTMAAVSAGTTVSGFLKMRDGSLFIVNLGDSCTAIVTKGRGLLYLTPAHNPSFQQEKLRINRAGGWVDEGAMGGSGLYSCGMGPARVKGVLAVSRSLGDWVLEKPSLLFGDAAVNNWDFGVYPADQFQPAHPELSPPIQAQDWVISKTPDIYHIQPGDLSGELLVLVCSDGVTDIHPAARWGHILGHQSPPHDSTVMAKDEWNVVHFCEILDKSFKSDNVTTLLFKLTHETTNSTITQ